MSQMTEDNYQKMQANCDGLCDINHKNITETDDGFMRCVTCPFCKQTVDAILTETTIACPACKKVVSRSS